MTRPFDRSTRTTLDVLADLLDVLDQTPVRQAAGRPGERARARGLILYAMLQATINRPEGGDRP